MSERFTLVVGVAFNRAHSQLGIAFVAHQTSRPGRNEPVIEDHSESHDRTAKNAGRFAMLRALEFAHERHATRVRIRSTEGSILKRLRRASAPGASATDELECRILEMASSFDEVMFRWQARRKNRRAQELARSAAGIARRTRDDDDAFEPWEHELDPAAAHDSKDLDFL